MEENALNVNAENPKKAPAKKVGFFKKILVTLKYRTKILPILVLVIGFVVFSLSLTNVSETTLYVGKTNMGLYMFLSYLFSILALVCLLNAFPKREKAKIPFVVLTFVLLAVVIAADVLYISLINQRFAEIAAGTANQPSEANLAYMNKARSAAFVHIIFEGIGLLLTALLPVIHMLFMKINTRVTLEENANIGDIDLSNDDDAEAKRSGGKRDEK